jgi:hypothetical protein
MKWIGLVLLCFALPAVAQNQPNAGPPKDFIRGKVIGPFATAEGVFLNAEFQINGETDPAGNYPKGVLQVRLPDRTVFHAVITCLVITTVRSLSGGPDVVQATISSDIVKRNDTSALNLTADGIIVRVAVIRETGDFAPQFFSSFLIRDSQPQHACGIGFPVPTDVDATGDVVIYDE